MKNLKNTFLMHVNPSAKEIDEALSAIYELTVKGARLYRSQCPVGFEELGAYVFNRVLKMLCTDAEKAGQPSTWQNGLSLWMSSTSWKTAPAYISYMMSSGFIDYTRSFYSEFRHAPTDANESMHIFEREDTEFVGVSAEDLSLAFEKLNTEDRKAMYKKFALDKASFSTEVRNWFESICAPSVVSVESVYDLTLAQIDKVKKGLLAFKTSDGVFYNVSVTGQDSELTLSPF